MVVNQASSLIHNTPDQRIVNFPEKWDRVNHLTTEVLLEH